MMDRIDVPEVSNDIETDFIVETISADEDVLHYGLYSKLRTYLYHFNIQKLKCKLLATTWLLASFVGIGFLLSGQLDPSLGSNLPILVLGLCLLSVCGIMLLAFLDVGVYHRNIESIFSCELEFENKYPHLSNTMGNMAKLLNRTKTGPVIFDIAIYMVYSSTLLLIAAFSLVVSEENPVIIGICSILTITAFNIGCIVFSRRSSLFFVHGS